MSLMARIERMEADLAVINRCSAHPGQPVGSRVLCKDPIGGVVTNRRRCARRRTNGMC